MGKLEHIAAPEIFALRVKLKDRLDSSMWAFDLEEQYHAAIALCQAWNLRYIAHHKSDKDGNPIPRIATARARSDAEYVAMSEGINDAWELKRAIEESRNG